MVESGETHTHVTMSSVLFFFFSHPIEDGFSNIREEDNVSLGIFILLF